MYPANYFGLFPPFPRRDTVFVAMSFEDRFDSRWSEVIAPAIRAVQKNGKSLEPLRVDTRQVSDSILTEILSGIRGSLLIFGDITTLGNLADRPVRSGNVMYEVGIAHAVRLPEEVLLFRSDSDLLLFDMANIRVNHYAPEEKPEETKRQLSQSILDAMHELDLRKHLAVRSAAESLDSPSWLLLTEMIQVDGSIAPPEMKTMGQALGNISRAASIRHLLDIGAIRTSYLSLTPERFEELKDSTGTPMLNYEITEFGKAVVLEGANRMGMVSPEMTAILEKMFEKSGAIP